MNISKLILVLILLPTFSFCQNKSYSNKIGKYKIGYFDNWNLKEEGEQIMLFAPSEGPNDLENENLGVSINSASGMNLEQCYKTYVTDALPQAFLAFEKIAEGNTEINGVKAKWIECKFKELGVSFTNLIYIMEKGNRLYILIGYVSTGKYPDYKDKFKSMIETFKLD